jgi:hypothetical protein
MITQIVDPHHFHQKARQIKARVPTILSQWGLPSKFNRWRLTQDPDSGMVVLFAVLNTRFIATHTATPFGDYFDPRLLHDLSNDLQMEVVSCNTDGLRYAFILDRGQIDILPTHIDIPVLSGDRLLVRVVYDDIRVHEVTEPQNPVQQPIAVDIADDQALVHRGVGAFLKVLDDIKLSDDAATNHSVQDMLDVVVIEAEKFNKQVAEYDADQKRSNHIKQLFDET